MIPFAAILYGAVAGGGLTGTAVSLQRLWKYLCADPVEQNRQDQQAQNLVAGIAEVIAKERFGTTIDQIKGDAVIEIRQEASQVAPALKAELDHQARTMFGKAFYRCNKDEKAEVREAIGRI